MLEGILAMMVLVKNQNIYIGAFIDATDDDYLPRSLYGLRFSLR